MFVHREKIAPRAIDFVFAPEEVDVLMLLCSAIVRWVSFRCAGRAHAEEAQGERPQGGRLVASRAAW